MNIGVMFFRHSEQTREFVAAWVARLEADPKAWDQNEFNNLARSGLKESKTHPSSPGLFYGFRGRLVIGVLPVSAFASGHTYHVQHLYQVRWFGEDARCTAVTDLATLMMLSRAP